MSTYDWITFNNGLFNVKTDKFIPNVRNFDDVLDRFLDVLELNISHQNNFLYYLGSCYMSCNNNLGLILCQDDLKTFFINEIINPTFTNRVFNPKTLNDPQATTIFTDSLKISKSDMVPSINLTKINLTIIRKTLPEFSQFEKTRFADKVKVFIFQEDTYKRINAFFTNYGISFGELKQSFLHLMTDVYNENKHHGIYSNYSINTVPMFYTKDYIYDLYVNENVGFINIVSGKIDYDHFYARFKTWFIENNISYGFPDRNEFIIGINRYIL
jgi:hypothetical protein